MDVPEPDVSAAPGAGGSLVVVTPGVDVVVV
jgi:hypothetical protein